MNKLHRSHNLGMVRRVADDLGLRWREDLCVACYVTSEVEVDAPVRVRHDAFAYGRTIARLAHGVLARDPFRARTLYVPMRVCEEARSLPR
jgi:hypothetical protein